MPTIIAIISGSIATLTFAMLGFLLLREKQPTGLRLATVLAAFLTAGWAASRASHWYQHDGFFFNPLSYNLETLRSAGWVVVLVILLQRRLGLTEKPRSAFTLAASLGFIVALQLTLVTASSLYPAFLLSQEGAITTIFTASRMVIAISGLVLLHNLYLNAGQQRGQQLRLLAIGLGIIFAYDLNLYTSEFLFGEHSVTLRGIRGLINSLAVPLIYLPIRNEQGGRLTLSHRAAFQTMSFAAIGSYLVVMALLAYGLRLTGGSWGALLQVTFLAVTLIALAFLVLSPRLRARLRVLIAQNFYRYRYDYRVEWLRFINTIDAREGDRLPFRERLIEAVATVLDSPAGGLLLPRMDGGFSLFANWQWPELTLPPVAENSSFVRFLAESGRVVNFTALNGMAPAVPHTLPDGSEMVAPDWASLPDLWLALPLRREQELLGIVLLHRSFAPRILNWEDYNLLRTLGRQGASYLSETAIQAQLDEAQSFEEYNRRATFVMHDLKNLVSQLALLARNAERHAANPEFQADMTATLKESVRKMGDLLQLMARDTATKGEKRRETPADSETVDLGQIVADVAAATRRTHPALALVAPPAPVFVQGSAREIEAMLGHLVQNAVDASPADGKILLILENAGGLARLHIRDHGHGMSQDFIETRLFQPFQSTKPDGFGIGVYEAREIVKAHGGDISVESTPGKGALFTILLPLAGSSAK